MSLEFYLPALDTEITAIKATIDGEAVAATSFSEHAIAAISIPVATAKAMFQFQSDSLDFTDTNTDDIKYYVNYDGTGAFYDLAVGNALVTSSDVALGASDAVNAVKHDFVRSLAVKLFNTVHGVDLFSNEAALVTDVATKAEAVRNTLRTLLAAVSSTTGTITLGESPDKHMLNTGAGHEIAGNLGRTIFRHIVASSPGRLVVGSAGGITNTASAQGIPFKANDYFVFKLTVLSEGTQTTVIGGAAPGAAVTPRIYKIKILLT